MHKFIDNIIAFSLKNKFFIFFCTVIAIIAGAVSFVHTPVDAFPDVNPESAERTKAEEASAAVTVSSK